MKRRKGRLLTMPEGYGLTARAAERLENHEEVSFQTEDGRCGLLVDWCDDVHIVFGAGDVMVRIPSWIEDSLAELLLRRHMEGVGREPIDLDKEE